MNAAPSKAKPKKAAAPKPVTSPPSKPDAKGSAIRVVEAGSCPSLTGKSTLGYDVGKDANDALYLRIRANSGGGKHSPEYFPLKALMEALEGAKPPLTSGSLRPAVRGTSANQAPFFWAVFLHKNLVMRSPKKERCYEKGPSFQAGAKSLGKPAPASAAASATVTAGTKPMKHKKSKAR